MAGSDRPPTGVLVMAYGTPASPGDIESYYTHVRRGRPPTPELVAELESRYRAIGGVSPLLERTRAQAGGLARELGEGWVVELGMKHAPPFIEEGMAALAAAGVERVVGLVLAPHYSSGSVGEYEARARAAAPPGVRVAMVRSWHLAEGYLDLLARRVRATVQGLGASLPHVLFTAHSLPERIVAGGDPYADQLEETAEAVAGRAGLVRWSVAWQSAGRTPEPWVGPDILAVLPTLADDGIDGVVVCPCGFVADHLEVLYDLDVEAAATAAPLGLRFARTPMPNDDPGFCATLAEVVRDRAGRDG